ncbi:hypothetical protein KN815_14655, partial [Streptomyces sp. 4503]
MSTDRLAGEAAPAPEEAEPNPTEPAAPGGPGTPNPGGPGAPAPAGPAPDPTGAMAASRHRRMRRHWPI